LNFIWSVLQILKYFFLEHPLSEFFAKKCLKHVLGHFRLISTNPTNGIQTFSVRNYRLLAKFQGKILKKIFKDFEEKKIR